MRFFQNSVLHKHLKVQDANAIQEAYARFKAHFHDPAIQENIRSSKEEQYQGEFLIDLFVEVLGYTKNPKAGFNLTTEYKNVKDSKKADGAILINGIVKAVIELKGTETTDLNRIEAQAFGYKNNQPECVYVVTSNFEKLRFYIDNAIEYIEFNLFTLTDKDFELLWLCLAYTNIERNIPKRIKDESVSQEDVITKSLYNDYSLFKRELHQTLVAHNPDHDPLSLYKKSQKLLDRFLFLFFAEDRQLLPPNSVRLILDDWRDLQDRDVEVALYARFKKYFEYLNTGFKGKRYDVFAYNGGLFKTDELLDGLKIDDELLYRHALKLSTYDFVSEVDVNILGHIFENSLNELDEIKAQLEGQQLDKAKSKRKKDGVFYTPKYITKYIVDNTVGKLCAEKKAEIQLIEEEYITDRKRQAKTIQALFDKLNTYRNWLLQLTICDPACGSGAFLNQALDFLINEHRYIDELQAKLFGDAMVLSDFEKTILENNLFGVDINEESVEIAKLSLWLRTAQPNRKLNDLNNNIKCGNSLIDDPAVAGDKAFNWHNEFPSVFAKGGFDVVIGNPPYVHLEKLKEISQSLSKMNYKTFDKRGDLYCLFVEQGFNILSLNGALSYIMPNKWLQAAYGKPLREYFLTYELDHLIDFGDIQIFEGATTYPCIFVSRKRKPIEEFVVSVLSEANKDDFYSNVERTAERFMIDHFSGDTWVISSGNEKKLIERLKKGHKTLSEYVGSDSYRGVLTGLTEAFLINQDVRQKLIQEDTNAFDVIKPFLQGRDVKSYASPKVSSYLILLEKGFTRNKIGYIANEDEAWNCFRKTYPSIADWLKTFEERGKKRTDKGDYWWEIRACDYYNKFSEQKIMYQAFQVKPCFIYDENGLYCNNSMWFIPSDNKGLLAILNSRMGWWLITKYCTQIQNGCQLIWKYFGQIPIPNTTENLAMKGDLMLSLNKVLQEASSKFQRSIQRKFNLEELPSKLQNWYLLSYKDFIAELAKKKVKLSLSEEAEWETYFLQEARQALALKAEISNTDQEIDRMVYALYGLTEEEIKIVEGTN
jgi:type I restriction-modification system DNA methylase subunit